jgi:hypothetical protein
MRGDITKEERERAIKNAENQLYSTVSFYSSSAHVDEEAFMKERLGEAVDVL